VYLFKLILFKDCWIILFRIKDNSEEMLLYKILIKLNLKQFLQFQIILKKKQRYDVLKS